MSSVISRRAFTLGLSTELAASFANAETGPTVDEPPLYAAFPAFRTALPRLPLTELPTPVDASDELRRGLGLAGLTIDQAFEDQHAALHYHLAWAAAFTFGGIVLLMLVARKGASEIGWVAAAFAIAHAATTVFGSRSPVGQAFVEELFHGEVLGVGVHEFETIATAFGCCCRTDRR